MRINRAIFAVAALLLSCLSLPAEAGLTFCWRMESSTLSAPDDFSVGDTAGSDNGTPTYGPTYTRYGTNGLQVNASAERVEFSATSIIFPSAGSVGLWVQYPTTIAGGGTAQIFFARGTNSNDYIQLYFAQSGTNRFVTLEIRHSTNGLVALAIDTTIAPGSWIYVKGAWDSTINFRRLEVLDNSLTTIDSAEDSSTVFTSNVPLNLTLIRPGDNAGNTDERWYDSLLIGSTSNEPFVENAAITSCSAYAGGLAGNLLLRRRRM